jgi:hypothetical protein
MRTNTEIDEFAREVLRAREEERKATEYRQRCEGWLLGALGTKQDGALSATTDRYEVTTAAPIIGEPTVKIDHAA